MLEICQGELVVLACSVLMMILMTEDTATVLNELIDQLGREFLLKLTTQKTLLRGD